MYMAKVDDATTAVGSDAGWFKVDEMGLASNNPDYWANQVLNVRVHNIDSYPSSLFSLFGMDD